VPERKNPFGVIEAFTRAFADGEGPLLWIKTLNGDKGWQQHERLLLAASGRSDIIIRDEHLSRPDQMAVLQAADCLVSLHRSEGLGLHCAEAMWLSKPVLATRYSGNVDFMDDSCAAMVDYTLVPVRHGQGIYPPEAMWAEPDVEQAAAHMRTLASDPALCAQLGARARARMAAQTSQAETGRMMAELATRHFTKGSI
jgi:glycosyltransferase involved in cell wall biosynthesis